MSIQTGAATFNIETILESVTKIENGHPLLVKDLVEGDQKLNFKTLSNTAGVYAFWWVGDPTPLTKEINKNHYKLKGPSDRKDLIPIMICDDWIDAATHQKKVCLYVGKSTKLKHRIQGHLKYTVEDIWSNTSNGSGAIPFSFEKKPNTVSQLRIGLERIFQNHSLEYIKKHVAISWLELKDTEEQNNAVNRFYIEDKLISHLFPIFNVDVER